MIRGITCAVVACLLAAGPLPAQQAKVGDPEVAKGIRLVEDGDYDGAIFTLDAAARRLATDPAHAADLPQAYLYLGIAYVGKGHEAAAKAKFREALKRAGDLSLSPDRYPPKVIDIFEAARNEVGTTTAPTPVPTPSPAAAKTTKGGGGKALLILGGVAVAGGGVALAAGGGSKSNGGASTPTTPNIVTTTFPNEVVGFGAGRDFVVDVKGSGTLRAKVEWLQDGVVLAMYVVNLANPQQVLADGAQTASKEVSLSVPVTPGSYRISVTNSSGAGPHVDTTFTLTVQHP